MIQDGVLVIDGSLPPEELVLKGIDAIEFAGYQNDQFKNEEIVKYVKKIQNIAKIKKLTIDAFISLEDLELLKHFPDLEVLDIGSEDIASFRGIEHFKKGKLLIVETGKNKKRSLEGIGSLLLETIYIEYGNSGDYEAIKNCLSLKRLAVGRGPAPDFEMWKDVPLERLKLCNFCKFIELKDMALIPSLKEVSVGAVRKFERFVGDNSNIKNLTVDGCRSFDISSLETCSHLEDLTMGAIPPVSLDNLPYLEHLKTFYLLGDVKLDFGKFNLKKKLPNLEMFIPPRGKKDVLKQLSECNEDVVIQHGEFKYKNGIGIKLY